MVERGDGRRRRQRHERQQRPEQDIDPEEGRVLVLGDVRALHGGRGQPEIAEPAQHASECRDHADQPEILRAQQPRQHDHSARAQRQAGHLRSQPRRPAADGLFFQILHCENLPGLPGERPYLANSVGAPTFGVPWRSTGAAEFLSLAGN